MMKRLPPWSIHLAFALVVVGIAVVGWRFAGSGGERFYNIEPRSSASRGPQDPALCVLPTVPRPPPTVDSPFGIHLFATTPLGVVRPLRAMAIVDQLGLPEMVSAAHSPTTVTTDAPVSVASSAGENRTSVAPNESSLDDVQSVVMLLEEFRRAFGAMPTGELNDEIVRRLQGENPKGIAVLPKSHPAIREGELIDRFGTPYRFHPESAWVTTVRSAGPDKKMWTGDDILSENLSPDLVQR